MIFVTTGTQFPFDRLLSFVEEWSHKNTEIQIVAQTGNTQFTSKNMELHPYLEPHRYDDYLKNAQIIVGHLGTGTIIDAEKYGVPAILMPRQFKLKEHRSEHQVATAKQFRDKKGIYIVDDKIALFSLLDKKESLLYPEITSNEKKQQLIRFLKLQVLEK
jgi:UDP-N-acetylglucosamine transferase subunit ALG13